MATGRAVADQMDLYAAPLRKKPGTLPGVIFCHGANLLPSSTVGTAFEYSNGLPLFNSIRENFTYGEGDFSGNSMGNDTAIGNVDDFRTWMQTMGAKSGKVAMFGTSMGAITSLNYAYAHPENVSCVAAIIPAVDLNYFANNPASSALVNAAYGDAYDDDTDGLTHNPAKYAADFPTDIPVHLWYSTGDNTVPYAQVEEFIENCPSAVGTIHSTTLDHGLASVAAVKIPDVLNFFATKANW